MNKTLKFAALLIGAGVAAIICLLLLVAEFSNQIEHRFVAFEVMPNGRQIVFSSASGTVWTLDLTTKQVEPYKLKIKYVPPSFSRDGMKLAFSAPAVGGPGDCLYLSSSIGTDLIHLTNEPDFSDRHASFSPDGKTILFVRAYRHRPYSMGGWTWDDYDICTVGANGTGFRRLTSARYYGLNSAQFTSDGRAILFSATEHQGPMASQAFIVGLSGRSTPRPLEGRLGNVDSIGAQASDIAVSPDRKHIAFISDRAEAYAYDVYVANMDGSDPRPLNVTKIAHYNENPRFLPDGRYLLYLAGTESNLSGRAIYSLWEVDFEGKTTEIADSGLFTYPDKWRSRRSPK